MDFYKFRFWNKQTNTSGSMITMTFQICSKDEMMLVILQNKLLQPFNPILQQEIINTKCKNRKKQEQQMHVNKK